MALATRLAERFDRENGEIEDGRRQLMVPLAEVPDDDQVDAAPRVEAPAGKRAVEDGGTQAPARPDLAGKVPVCLFTRRATASRHCRSSPHAFFGILPVIVSRGCQVPHDAVLVSAR